MGGVKTLCVQIGISKVVLAPKEYKARCNGIGTRVHQEQYKCLRFNWTDKRYEHKPEAILENSKKKYFGS